MHTNRRKIILFADSLSPGGAERQLLLLVKNLPDEWEPIVISLTSGPLFEEYSDAGIQIHIAKRKFRFDAFSPIKKIYSLLRMIEPDIVHSWGWMSTIASSICLIGTGIPHISSIIRMGQLPERRRYMSKICSMLGDVTIANSMAGMKSWNISSLHGRVIYNGFDRDRLKDYKSVNQNMTDFFHIIMIATMSKLKDWEKYIDTAKYITKHHYDREIVFIGNGDGPMREGILEDAEDLVNIGRMRLPGRISDPIGACFNVNIGVLLSPYGEGISNSIMEYMACGLPVICTRSGGNPELVIEGVTGFLVDSNNPPEQIAEKILWLQDNPDKAKEMGKAGKERILKQFSTEKMVEAYLSIYHEALIIHNG